MKNHLFLTAALLTAVVCISLTLPGCARSRCCVPAVISNPCNKTVYLDQPARPGAIEVMQPPVSEEPYRPEGVKAPEKAEKAEAEAPEKEKQPVKKKLQKTKKTVSDK
jgi:hypothetical protein